MIRLEAVSMRTFESVVNMKLPPEQSRFVASNVYSLAQSWLFYGEALPFAICNGDEAVGFLMLDWDNDERTVGIWRIMIAPEHQRKGYGRKAIEAAIELARGSDEIDMMYLSCADANTVARELYNSIGFRENGDVENDEIIMTMPLTDNPRVGMLAANDSDTEDIAELIGAEIAAGNHVPPELRDLSAVDEAVKDGRINRFTLMGDTVGISYGDAILLGSEYISRMPEAAALLEKKRSPGAV